MNEIQLSAELRAECAATAKAVEFVAQSRFKQEKSMPQVEGLIRKVDIILDSKVVEAQAKEVPRACRIGCDHCCHRVVLATVPEVLAVVQHIERNVSAEKQAAIKTRLNDYVHAIAPLMGRDLDAQRVTCPMLEEGRCSIYEVRPLLCRASFSTDAEMCRQAKDGHARLFPLTLTEEMLGLAAKRGITSVTNHFYLTPMTVDFARSVDLALNVPRIRDQYLGGGSGFDFVNPVTELPTPPSPPPGFGVSHYSGNQPPTGIVDESAVQRVRFLLQTRGDAETALAPAPGDGPLQKMIRAQVPMSYQSADEIEYWRGRMVEAFETFVADRSDPREKFDAIAVYNPLSLSYQQRDDRAMLSDIGDYLTNELAARVLPEFSRPIPKRKREGKLRVGYIGTGLGYSSGSLWASGWVRNHSPDIETFAFYLNAKKISGTEFFSDHVDHYFHCPGPIAPIAALIKQQKLDVLIYPDPTCEGRHVQFATLRLAPVQCGCWGDPQTTGLPNIDYFLGSDWMEPVNAQSFYREQLVRLPRTGVCYPTPNRRGSGLDRARFGLDDGPLFLCLQAAAKMLPEWDWVYREICERTGRPIVFFGYHDTAWRVAERRLRSAGVRAIFSPFVSLAQLSDLLSMADMSLDTFGWSGGITALLALQQRVPVLTLPGQFRRGRHSMAFLKAANAPGLIASDPADYLDLACNPDRRRAAMEEASPEDLFEDKSSLTALEAFLHSVAWEH